MKLLLIFGIGFLLGVLIVASIFGKFFSEGLKAIWKGLGW